VLLPAAAAAAPAVQSCYLHSAAASCLPVLQHRRCWPPAALGCCCWGQVRVQAAPLGPACCCGVAPALQEALLLLLVGVVGAVAAVGLLLGVVGEGAVLLHVVGVVEAQS